GRAHRGPAVPAPFRLRRRGGPRRARSRRCTGARAGRVSAAVHRPEWTVDGPGADTLVQVGGQHRCLGAQPPRPGGPARAAAFPPPVLIPAGEPPHARGGGAQDRAGVLALAPPRYPPVWRLLLGYVKPHRWTLIAGGLLSLATAATGLALPLVARR